MNRAVGTPAARPVRMPVSRVRSSSPVGRARGGSVLSGPDQGGDADHRGDEDADGEEIASHRAHAPYAGGRGCAVLAAYWRSSRWVVLWCRRRRGRPPGGPRSGSSPWAFGGGRADAWICWWTWYSGRCDRSGRTTTWARASGSDCRATPLSVNARQMNQRPKPSMMNGKKMRKEAQLGNRPAAK